jgi:pilus assembly protein Flp/PilA
MARLLLAFMQDEDGATAIEYGLIAALIAVAAIVGMTATGTSIQGVFGYTANKAGNVWDSAP